MPNNKDKKPTRPSADSTRKQILSAAKKLFMQKGYAGTSISNIAQAAKANSSLIFHHFGNKENLWLQVKEELISDAKPKPVSTRPDSLKQFLEEAISQILAVKKESPLFFKMVAWARVEPLEDKDKIIGTTSSPVGPLSWLPAIESLKERAVIRSDINSHLLMLWLVASLDPIIHDDLHLFQDEALKASYIEMLMSTLMAGFAPDPLL